MASMLRKCEQMFGSGEPVKSLLISVAAHMSYVHAMHAGW